LKGSNIINKKDLTMPTRSLSPHAHKLKYGLQHFFFGIGVFTIDKNSLKGHRRIAGHGNFFDLGFSNGHGCVEPIHEHGVHQCRVVGHDYGGFAVATGGGGTFFFGDGDPKESKTPQQQSIQHPQRVDPTGTATPVRLFVLGVGHFFIATAGIETAGKGDETDQNEGCDDKQQEGQSNWKESDAHKNLNPVLPPARHVRDGMVDKGIFHEWDGSDPQFCRLFCRHGILRQFRRLRK
jgi:hypothetical protein